jgi:protocatechuate 3,4-dioxygenase beta subunit
MQRRKFLRDTAVSVFAVSTSGFIRYNGTMYIGDCETTTDILGPFYRPDSPIRTNLVVSGEPGTKILLTGKIRHNDCVTPYTDAKVEIWHCSSTGEYDNDSDAFLHRGTTFTDDEGNYHFNTILPVPYGVGNGRKRPAHFHLMITAKGYQPFVTQLYFAGDEHISNDPSASAASAKRRILTLQTLADGTKKVKYNISMSPRLAAETAAIDKITGLYKDTNTGSTLEFFRENNMLWLKNDVYGTELEYIGSNTFQYSELNDVTTYSFDIKEKNHVKLTRSNTAGEKTNVSIAMKSM